MPPGARPRTRHPRTSHSRRLRRRVPLSLWRAFPSSAGRRRINPWVRCGAAATPCTRCVGQRDRRWGAMACLLLGRDHRAPRWPSQAPPSRRGPSGPPARSLGRATGGGARPPAWPPRAATREAGGRTRGTSEGVCATPTPGCGPAPLEGQAALAPAPVGPPSSLGGGCRAPPGRPLPGPGPRHHAVGARRDPTQEPSRLPRRPPGKAGGPSGWRSRTAQSALRLRA